MRENLRKSMIKNMGEKEEEEFYYACRDISDEKYSLYISLITLAYFLGSLFLLEYLSYNHYLDCILLNPHLNSADFFMLFIVLGVTPLVFYSASVCFTCKMENNILNWKLPVNLENSCRFVGWLASDDNYLKFPKLCEYIKNKDGIGNCEFVKKGLFLDELYKSKNPEVRKEVANHGSHLKELVSDENASVRYAVAEQGYGLDKLCKDEDKNVASLALQMLATYQEQDCIDKWSKENQDKVA